MCSLRDRESSRLGAQVSVTDGELKAQREKQQGTWTQKEYFVARRQPETQKSSLFEKVPELQGPLLKPGKRLQFYFTDVFICLGQELFVWRGWAEVLSGEWNQTQEAADTQISLHLPCGRLSNIADTFSQGEETTIFPLVLSQYNWITAQQEASHSPFLGYHFLDPTILFSSFPDQEKSSEPFSWIPGTTYCNFLERLSGYVLMAILGVILITLYVLT